jgi:taurine transport system substrate-binding protein
MFLNGGVTAARNRSLRRGMLLAIVALLLGLVGGGCGASEGGGTSPGGAEEGQGGKPARLRIGYQVIPNGDPIVKQKRWLEQELKIPVDWQQFDSGANVNRAVASGSVDIGLAGSSPVANGISTGLPYKVAWIFDVIGDNEELVVRSNERVTNLQGLEGKKVAAPFGSTTHYSLLTALAQAGVNAKRVDVLDLEPDDIVAAWQRRDIDAAYVWNPSLAKLKPSKVLVSSAQLAQRGTLTGDLGIVRRDFAEKYPNVVTAWVRVEDRAVKLYKNDPKAAARAVAKELGMSSSEALAQMKGLIWLTAAQQASPKYLGTKGRPGDLAKQIEKTARFLKDQKIIDTAASQEDVNNGVDGQFVAKVAGR